MAKPSTTTETTINTAAPAACTDWQSPDNYPKPGSKNVRKWTWEFLRRNKEYEKDADKMVALPWELQLRSRPSKNDSITEYTCDPSPPPHIKTYAEYKKHFGSNGSILTPLQLFRLKWNVKYAHDARANYATISKPPKINTDQLGLSERLKKRLHKHHFRIDTGRSTFLRHSLLSEESNQAGKKALTDQTSKIPYPEKRSALLWPNHVMLRFHLHRKLPTQIERAERELEKLQCRYLQLLEKGLYDDRWPLTNANRVKENLNKDIRVQPKSLHFVLRTYDAACKHNAQSNRVLPDAIVQEIKDKFNEQSEMGLYNKFNQDDIPKFTKSQVKDWYSRAWSYINEFGYINLAASVPNRHRPSRAKKQKSK